MAYIVKGSAVEDEPRTLYDTPAAALRGLATLVAVICGYLVWQFWSFEAMAVLLGPATLLAMGERNPVIYAVVLALAGGVYVVFTQLLGTQF